MDADSSERVERGEAEPEQDPALLPFSQRIALFASAADASSPTLSRASAGSHWATPVRTSAHGSTSMPGTATTARAPTVSATYASRPSLRLFDAATAAAARDAAYRFFTGSLRSDWQGRPVASTPVGAATCTEAATQTDAGSGEGGSPMRQSAPPAAADAAPGCASPDCTAQLVIRPARAADCAAAAAAELEQAGVAQLLSAAAALQTPAAHAAAADRPWLAVVRLLADYVAEQQQAAGPGAGKAAGPVEGDAGAEQAATAAPDARLLAALLTARMGAEREAAAGVPESAGARTAEVGPARAAAAGASQEDVVAAEAGHSQQQEGAAGSEGEEQSGSVAGQEADSGVAVAALQEQVAALREQMRQRALAQYDNNRWV
mgnify:CR=1 FL=1